MGWGPGLGLAWAPGLGPLGWGPGPWAWALGPWGRLPDPWPWPCAPASHHSTEKQTMVGRPSTPHSMGETNGVLQILKIKKGKPPLGVDHFENLKNGQPPGVDHFENLKNGQPQGGGLTILKILEMVVPRLLSEVPLAPGLRCSWVPGCPWGWAARGLPVGCPWVPGCPWGWAARGAPPEACTWQIGTPGHPASPGADLGHQKMVNPRVRRQFFKKIFKILVPRLL